MITPASGLETNLRQVQRQIRTLERQERKLIQQIMDLPDTDHSVAGRLAKVQALQKRPLPKFPRQAEDLYGR